MTQSTLIGAAPGYQSRCFIGSYRIINCIGWMNKYNIIISISYLMTNDKSCFKLERITQRIGGENDGEKMGKRKGPRSTPARVGSWGQLAWTGRVYNRILREPFPFCNRKIFNFNRARLGWKRLVPIPVMEDTNEGKSERAGQGCIFGQTSA